MKTVNDASSINIDNMSDETKAQINKVLALLASSIFWFGCAFGIISFAVFGTNLVFLLAGYFIWRLYSNRKSTTTNVSYG